VTAIDVRVGRDVPPDVAEFVAGAGALVIDGRAGTVWVNTYGEIDASVSFGGYEDSGLGRELRPHAVEAYTQPTSVWMAT
jgi:acyl-CoA reductase-like NAD-dependent aldehyde dehydrogenase